MKKKIGILGLLAVMIANQLGGFTGVSAYTEPYEVQYGLEERKVLESEKIYVQDGNGEINDGKGTAKSPYQNIRTALNRIQPGQYLVLMGNVYFTEFEEAEDGSAIPLFLDKNITIMGDTPTASFIVRTTIQLGADVTFKNMHLQMIPETILGDGSGSRILGTLAKRSTTIYAAGHTLVLDNVNTKVGTNQGQDYMRPYISGGTYKGGGNHIGNHTVINVKNPNVETKLSAIYAGDYFYWGIWRERTI